MKNCLGEPAKRIGLKPCPFCGEMPEFKQLNNSSVCWLIHRCPAVGLMKIDWCGSPSRAVEQWNTRAPK